MTTTGSKFEHDRFFIDLRENYVIYDEDDHELFYVDAPWRFLGKHEITVYDDESLQSPVLLIREDDYGKPLHDNYAVTTPDGEVIARLSRHQLTSLLRDTWEITDAGGGLVARAREGPAARAVVRRELPGLGGLVKTDFRFLGRDSLGNEETLGSLDRRGRPSDDHLLNLSADLGRRLDRRIALATALLLDKAR